MGRWVVTSKAATNEINQAVKNNPKRFPVGFVFELTTEEKYEVVKNFDHLHSIKFSKVNPKVFTEQGLYTVHNWNLD